MQGDENSDIEKVTVSLQYTNGAVHTFQAKGGGESSATQVQQRDDTSAAELKETELQKQQKIKQKTLETVLFTKAKHRISYRGLHELRLAGFPNIPSKKRLREESQRLATILDIFPLSFQDVS